MPALFFGVRRSTENGALVSSHQSATICAFGADLTAPTLDAGIGRKLVSMSVSAALIPAGKPALHSKKKPKGYPMRLFNACALLLALVFSMAAGVSAQPISDQAMVQIQSFLSEKNSWTAAEQKLQSTLLYAARVRAQGSMGAGLPASILGIDA